MSPISFPGLLVQFFESLAENEVISAEAFEAWKACDDPAEQAGKGVAIKSATQFFIWLKEEAED